MKCITVMNQKGGVGKTTTAANLGVALARRGRRMLLVDLDPQAHLTIHLGVDPDAGHPNSYTMLTHQQPICEVRTPVEDRLWLVASHLDLAAADSELVSFIGRETLLQDALDDDEGQYDYVIIDCPPSLGVLTLNGLCAADDVLIPMQAHFLALQGVSKLLETIQLVHRRLNPRIRVGGVLLCMYESATRLGTEVTQDLNDFFTESRGGDTPWSQTRLYQTVIRRNIKLAECPSHGLSVFDYAPRSHGALDYGRLSEEILKSYEGESVLCGEGAMPQLDTSCEAALPSDESPAELTIAQDPVQLEAPSDSRCLLSAAEVEVEPDDAAPQEVVSRACQPFAGQTGSLLDTRETLEEEAVVHGAEASDALFMFDPCPAAEDGELGRSARPFPPIASHSPADSRPAESGLCDSATLDQGDGLSDCEDALPGVAEAAGADESHLEPIAREPSRPFAPLAGTEARDPQPIDSVPDGDATILCAEPGEDTHSADVAHQPVAVPGPQDDQSPVDEAHSVQRDPLAHTG